MDTFKDRVLYVIARLFYWIGMFLVAAIVAGLFLYLCVNVEWIGKTLEWTALGLFGFCILGAVLVMLLKIIMGIRWLIYGPDKKEEK